MKHHHHGTRRCACFSTVLLVYKFGSRTRDAQEVHTRVKIWWYILGISRVSVSCSPLTIHSMVEPPPSRFVALV